LNASSDLLGGDAQLKILVCDHVGMKPSALEKASRELSRILRATGIAVSVHHVTEASTADSITCGTRLEGRYIPVILIPERLSTASKDAMGLALRGLYPRALIFMDRLRDFGNQHWSRAKGDFPILVAHVMAHELGHLLMPAKAHTAFGLMSTAWGAQQAALMASGNLLFHTDEARVIRQGLLQELALAGN
jgi:hypothetical protein